jgi:predicted  nucleic acid-binding Zn-ribbon protein
MSMVAKILIVLNLVLAVAVMGAAGAYLQSAETWKKSYTDTKAQLDNEIRELRDTMTKTQSSLDEANRKASAATQDALAKETALKVAEESNKVLQKKLDDLVASNQTIAAKMADLESGLNQARAQNEKLLGEKKSADDERRAAMEAKGAAENEQKRLQNELNNATSMLDASQKDKASLADKLEASNTALEMYREKFGGIGLVAAPVKGMVLAADPKMDIYLVSVGKKDSVKIGDELTVYRGDQFVAVVVVDKLFEDKASVTVKREGGKAMKKDGMDIRQGDKVATVY